MDNLPPELLLIIAKELPVKSCYYLSLTSKQYNWLLQDISLWQHYAERDLDCPTNVFDTNREKRLTACQVYQRISQCQANVEIDDGHFVQKCNLNALPGCSFCLEHCEENDISLCVYCEIRIAKDDRFCVVCRQTKANLKGCQYKRSGEQCGCKRVDGSKYCQSCIYRYHPDISDERSDEIHVTSCPHLGGGYMIDSGDLVNIVIMQNPDGALIAQGKIPSTLTCHTITSLNQLIPLTTEEIGLVVEKGMGYSP